MKSNFSTFTITLNEYQHDRVAEYAVQNGLAMSTAVTSLFLDGYYNSMKPEIVANSKRNQERAAQIGGAA